VQRRQDKALWVLFKACSLDLTPLLAYGAIDHSVERRDISGISRVLIVEEAATPAFNWDAGREPWTHYLSSRVSAS
jgi:hypothetical protein